MSTDPACESVRSRLTEAWLARSDAALPDLAHARSCRDCGVRWEELRSLARALDSEPVPVPGAEVGAAALRRAQSELSRGLPAAPPPDPAALPRGFARELARLLGWTALPLPGVALALAAALHLGAALLGPVLPAPVVGWLGFALALAAASWLALIYGSLPFVAYHRTSRRPAGGAR